MPGAVNLDARDEVAQLPVNNMTACFLTDLTVGRLPSRIHAQCRHGVVSYPRIAALQIPFVFSAPESPPHPKSPPVSHNLQWNTPQLRSQPLDKMTQHGGCGEPLDVHCPPRHPHNPTWCSLLLPGLTDRK
ncbi:hypothetical protein K469DRAFT_274644 [Zopfia rhizophila CBS 207.26]|uniref:Uncharacterized protein n=1 Tax=Zopfia rhizophila CBS 207.26 TaxID=1314779 RepID=A0A6A6DSB3_9PEZI|nr:hypothetical protein K469DRAFT_274644 [Zopfia rhizophila CBS 207.26]